jgi:hypothetical protein
MNENSTPVANQTSNSEKKVTKLEGVLQQISKEVNYLQVLENTFTSLQKDDPNFSANHFNNQKLKKLFLEFQETGSSISNEDKKKFIGLINQELNLWRKQIVELEKPVTAEKLRFSIEKANPPIHHTILISLARFYFVFKDSAEKRSKFENLAMFLFNDEIENQKRKLIRDKAEIVKSYDDVFVNWTKKQEISFEKNLVNVVVTELDNFVKQVEECKKLAELREKDILSNYKKFKQNLGKGFYHQDIFIEILEKNTKIGNIIIDKIIKEMSENREEFLLQSFYDFEVQFANSLCKSLNINNIKPFQEPKAIKIDNNVEYKTVNKKASKISSYSQSKPKTRKWLIAACIISILITLGLNFGYILELTQKKTAEAEVVNQKSLPNGQYLAEAKIQNKTLQIIVKDDWDKLTPDAKKETATKIMALGPETGYNEIVFMKVTGEQVAKANDAKVEIVK